MSHLILIWDPLNFYHFCTLQIKLSNFDRFTAPPQDGPLHYLSNKQRNGLTQLISMKSMAIYLIILYYFYTN